MKAIISGKEDQTGLGYDRAKIRLIAETPAEAKKLKRFEEILSNITLRLAPDGIITVREGHSRGKKRLENMSIEFED